jgi:hypothetical protein
VNLSVSQPIKAVALVGLLAIVALGGMTMVLGKKHEPAATQAPTHAHRRATPAATVATHTKPAKVVTPAKHAHAKPATHVKTPAKAHTATKHKAATRVVPRHSGNKVYADLPAPLQWQLSQHKIVVVSLYNPNANVDAISVAEAHRGALDAGAGFLLVSVLDNKVAGILTALLPGGGLLPAPGILVYRAPGTIALRIDGFADRVSVAQAAQNALSGETGPTPVSAAAAAAAAAVPVAAVPTTVTP